MHGNNDSGKRVFDNTAPGGGRVDPSKVDIDGPNVDSGFDSSPKNSTIRIGNSSKFLRPDYYGEGRYDDSAKDSGFGPSSARSSFNKPKTTFDQPSIKRTSISKKSDCCIL